MNSVLVLYGTGDQTAKIAERISGRCDVRKDIH